MEINIQEIFDKYSQLCQFEEGDPEYLIDKEDFSLAIKEVLEIVLKEAADSAEITKDYCGMKDSFMRVKKNEISTEFYAETPDGYDTHTVKFNINRDSITSTINKVKF